MKYLQISADNYHRMLSHLHVAFKTLLENDVQPLVPGLSINASDLRGTVERRFQSRYGNKDYPDEIDTTVNHFLEKGIHPPDLQETLALEIDLFLDGNETEECETARRKHTRSSSTHTESNRG